MDKNLIADYLVYIIPTSIVIVLVLISILFRYFKKWPKRITIILRDKNNNLIDVDKYNFHRLRFGSSRKRIKKNPFRIIRFWGRKNYRPIIIAEYKNCEKYESEVQNMNSNPFFEFEFDVNELKLHKVSKIKS